MKRKIRKEVYFVSAVILLMTTLLIIISTHKPSQPYKATMDIKKNANISSSAASKINNSDSSYLDKTVILDPGHGGPDPGATGVGGIIEKDLNLAIALKLRDAFVKDGYTVIMTRSDDRSIYDPGCTTLAEMKNSDLDNRIRIMQEHPHGLFISIHQNFSDNAKYSGTQVYYSENNSGSINLARMIQSGVQKALEPSNKRGVQPPEKLRVLLKADVPAVLVECGFISNAAEAANLVNSDYQDKLVSAIETAADLFYNENS